MSVPVARRQLLSEPTRLAATILAVAAATALVLLLSGLRRGIVEQATAYLDHQPAVLVHQRGVDSFLGADSALPESVGARLRTLPGVEAVSPLTTVFTVITLHGQQVALFFVGYDPGADGGPWRLAEGRAPRGDGELVLDATIAREHRVRVGDRLDLRGADVRVVGLSSGTAGWLSATAFLPRRTLNANLRRAETATFFLVEPQAGVAPVELVSRINERVPGVAASTRDELAASDRRLYTSAFASPLLAMVAIAAFVGALVVALTIYTAVIDRRREFATLKVIGLGRRRLVALVAAQALAVGVLGTALGVASAFVSARLVEQAAPKYAFAISPTLVLFTAAGALVLALLGSLPPARFLDRLDPAEALRR